jgi:hypothetical protein
MLHMLFIDEENVPNRSMSTFLAASILPWTSMWEEKFSAL